MRSQLIETPVFIGGHAYREIMTAFPTGVAVVTSTGLDGRPVGLTVNSLMSVSAEPPILAVSIAGDSRSLAGILESRAFCVNFMGEQSEDICRHFASHVDEKFESVSWARTRGGVPVLLEGTAAVAECTVVGEYEIGDHVVVAGLVRAGVTPVADVAPLIYARREFRRLAGRARTLAAV